MRDALARNNGERESRLGVIETTASYRDDSELSRRQRWCHIPSAGQFTIQGMPNLSTHMPKPLDQKVLLKGMVTVPPSASALNLRSPSAGSATVSEIENPCGFSTCSGGASVAMSTLPPGSDIRACMIVFSRPGAAGASGGASEARSIISILPPRTLA